MQEKAIVNPNLSLADRRVWRDALVDEIVAAANGCCVDQVELRRQLRLQVKGGENETIACGQVMMMIETLPVAQRAVADALHVGLSRAIYSVYVAEKAGRNAPEIERVDLRKLKQFEKLPPLPHIIDFPPLDSV